MTVYRVKEVGGRKRLVVYYNRLKDANQEKLNEDTKDADTGNTVRGDKTISRVLNERQADTHNQGHLQAGTYRQLIGTQLPLQRGENLPQPGTDNE